MPKTLLQFSLDTASPHDKLVYDLIAKQPAALQKEFLTSAVLYYARSPSFLTEMKMTEYLGRLEDLNKVFGSENFQAMKDRIESLLTVKDSLVAEVAAAVAKKLDGMEFSGPVKGKKKQATTDIPEDAIDAMAEAFTT
jgi:tRNA(His) 5'-end guanylyltransferase